MTTFAIFAPSCTGDFDLRSVDGDELNVKPMKKEIELATCHNSATGFQYN
ncbi:MAG TPA: hypothetical protein VIW93_17275 [Candidatus Acidoferrum sp.]